jgi:hypothetical protein
MSKSKWTPVDADTLVRSIRAKDGVLYTDTAMYMQLVGWMKQALAQPETKKHAEYFFDTIKTLGK